MSQVKKLSVATVFGAIKPADVLKNKNMELMTVMGSAIGTKKGVTQYGEYTALTGRFRATSLKDGKIDESSVLFLPDVALLPILTAMASPDHKGVDFAIKVGVRYVGDDEGYKAGGSIYEYWFEPLLQAGAEDPLERIAARLAAQEQAKLANNPTPEAKPEAGKKGGK